MPAPDNIDIVLVGTTHPGNIGAAARAMKNMGLGRLALVAPRTFPSADATARAAGADDILARAAIHPTLGEAVAGAAVVIGASSRGRAIGCPLLTPRECAALVTGQAGRAAIVFGREHSGLTNEEIDLCRYQLYIPADPGFPSLNVAAAVQIVCYEIHLARLAAGAATGSGTRAAWPVAAPADAPGRGVSHEDMERLYEHLETVLTDLGFLDPRRPRHLMRRLRRLFNRACPDRNEVNILRGILTAVQDHGDELRRRMERSTPPPE